MTNSHAATVSEILALCGARQDCRIWGNNSGVARGLTGNGIVRFGLRGSADIIGLTCDGLFLALEVKTGSGRQRPEQRAFEAMITKFGGRYALVHSAAEAKVFLDGLGLLSRQTA